MLAAVDAHPRDRNRSLEIAGVGRGIDIDVPDSLNGVEAEGARHRHAEILGESHELILGVDVVNGAIPAFIRAFALLGGAEVEHRGPVLWIRGEQAGIDVPDDLAAVAETDPLIMAANRWPLGLEVRMQLDQVAGIAGAEGAPGVQVIAEHPLRSAAHDIVIQNPWRPRRCDHAGQVGGQGWIASRVIDADTHNVHPSSC